MAAMDSLGETPPVFFKNEDMDLDILDVCEGVAAVIGKENVLGAQKIRNLWRIYLSSEECRILLISEGLELKSTPISLHAQNPYSANPGGDSIKVTVKDIPLSYSNTEVENFLKALGAKLTSDVQCSKVRDKMAN